MEAEVHIHQEKQHNGDRRRGILGTIFVHVLILLLLIIPFITFPIPPPGQEGIQVALGIPDSGQGDDRSPKKQETTKAAAAPVQNKEPEPQVAQASPPPEPEQRKVVTTESPDAIAMREAEKEAQKRREEEQRKLAEAEAAKRQAELEAQKRAEEEARKQAEFEENKQQFGALLSGSGKGKTDNPGTQGRQDGDPDATKLEGISKGSGMVGGGLSDRGVLYEPSIDDNSQKTGRVVVNVCVDQSGDVISATYTQRGSTTTDADLRTLAERSARKFRFTASEIEKQCGTITIDFKVQ